MMIGRGVVALVVAGVLAGSAGGCGGYDKVQRSGRDLQPYNDQNQLTDEQTIELIDGMRAKGSYEAARERLTATARVIAERISAAIPGQTWKFDDDPYGQRSARGGLPCEKLTGDIARRPIVDSVIFGSTFSAEGFRTAAGVVAEQAAKYGADADNALFDDATKRDYTVQGNGYEFNLGQIKFATVNIHGDCFLLQQVLDSPPGQLPPTPTP